jgi:Domain of unknown function (DUF4388)
MESQDLIMDGDLQTLGLQSILKMLALSGKTGTLFIQSGRETLSISLRKGQIVSLREEGVNQPDLLTMLCLMNRLDPQRAQAMREAAQGNMQVALPFLVEQNWMTPAEMQQRLEFAITQSVSHALRWVNGRFSFHRRVVALEGRMHPLDVDSVLLEALRQADEWEEMGDNSLTRATMARWLPEVSNDVRSLGLNQDHIDVLCLANGEVPLQAMAMALMLPEARVARILTRLFELRLVEMVDTALEGELQQDLTNIIIMSQHTLAQQRQNSAPDQHLLGLIKTLSQCINGLLIHHGAYAKALRGRGQLPVADIVSYLEKRFAGSLHLMATQQFPILETASFVNGQLDCSEIFNLNHLVRGEQLEEFYWEAVRGLAVFLRTVFTTLLNDEVGNSYTGRQLNVVWKTFLTEIDQEIQQYQLYRAGQHAQSSRNRLNDTAYQGDTNWKGAAQKEGTPHWSSEWQRRSI